MIQDIDETLRKMLVDELGRIPGCPVYDPQQITFDPPDQADAAQDGEARINLYLHDVRENLDRREEGIFRRGGAKDPSVGLRRSHIYLDMAYVVTAHAGDDPALEHRLLSDVLAVMLRYGAVPKRYWHGEIQGIPGGVPLAVIQPKDLELLNSVGTLQAFHAQMRPALSVVATAAFDPFETKWTRRVREIAVGMGPGAAGAGEARPEGLATTRVSIAGIVLDQRSEEPLADAQVQVDGYDAVTSNKEGLFSLIDLPPGHYIVRFQRRGYRENQVETVVPPLGRSDQWEPIVIGLRALEGAEREAERAGRTAAAQRDPGSAVGRPAVSITGTVRLTDGSAAAFVEVRTGANRTVTDVDGIYSFFDLIPGEYTVIADIPGQGATEVQTVRVR